MAVFHSPKVVYVYLKACLLFLGVTNDSHSSSCDCSNHLLSSTRRSRSSSHTTLYHQHVVRGYSSSNGKINAREEGVTLVLPQRILQEEGKPLFGIMAASELGNIQTFKERAQVIFRVRGE